MKKIIIALALILLMCPAIYAQKNAKLTKVYFQDGTMISANVERQEEGGYKLTTEDGSVFFFREDEISLGKPFKQHRNKEQITYQSEIQMATQQPEVHQVQSGLKYRELKKIYSAKDYKGPQPGDKYSPAIIGVASLVIPGMGQFITGSQVGWGIMQSFLFGMSLPIFIKGVDHSDVTQYAPGAAIWGITAIWSSLSAAKAAKIKNLYYRDLRNGIAYQFDVTPYFDATAPTLASNQNFVTGLSFRVTF